MLINKIVDDIVHILLDLLMYNLNNILEYIFHSAITVQLDIEYKQVHYNLCIQLFQ